ncbi:hypothetical protein BGZ94_000142 [Podila epigama]|nr:hypothetical protein BGZ94_000142 [Podila epigama]
MDKSVAAKDSTEGGASLASLSFEILGELLEEIILDVVSEAHRDVKNMRSICPRYAPHLEKCLGLAGRASSRVASRRMGAGERAGSGSPFTPVSYSDDREASDSDKDLIEKKRKKNAGSNGNGYGSGTGVSSSKENGDYAATQSPSKSSTVSLKIKKPKQTDSSEYPAKLQKVQSTNSTLQVIRPARVQPYINPKGSSSSSKLKGLGLYTSPATSTGTSSSSSSTSSSTPSVVPRPPTPVGEISLGFLEDNILLANGRALNYGGAGGAATSVAHPGGTSLTPQKLSSSNPKRANALAAGLSSQKRPPGTSNNGVKKSAASLISSSLDSHDTGFIDIDGDGDEGMDILQTPKKKKS